MVFDREKAVADDGLDYFHLNHAVIRRLLDELTGDSAQPGLVQFRLGAGVSLPGVSSQPVAGGAGFFAAYRLRMTNHADYASEALLPVFIDCAGQPHPRLAQALLDLTPAQIEPAFLPDAEGLAARLRSQAWTLAEQKAGDLFSEAELDHAQRLAAERRKVEKYYRQQESAVGQIAIENIRQAKQRELFERRHADLLALESRVILVPQLDLVGAAVIAISS